MPTLAEATDSYRDALIFGNALLVGNFRERRKYKMDRRVNEMKKAGVDESRTEAYVIRYETETPRKVELYEKKLADRVEGSVRRYVANLKSALLGIDYMA